VFDNEADGSSKPSAELHLFIEDAIKELLKARRILRCSYVCGYYLDTFGHQKFIFEFIQTEFEECTENLSQIIARPHLKTPKHKIIRLTNLLKRKRIEFIDTITRGLNSFNDTPPALKKYSRQRWKYLLKDNIQNDDEFKNTIALSLKELNPKNPWIIDKKGRHTNFLALLDDWPELESELDSILIPSKDKKGLCANWNCGNVRAVNTLSGSLCNYCSIRCMRNDHNNYLEQKKNLGKRCDPGTSVQAKVANKRAKKDSLTSSNLPSDLSKSKTKLLAINDDSEKTSSFYLSEKSLKSFDEMNEVEEEDVVMDYQSKLKSLEVFNTLQKESNFYSLEFDIKKAIELSLLNDTRNSKANGNNNRIENLTHFAVSDEENKILNTRATTSKSSNKSLIQSPAELLNHPKLMSIDYDSLFLNANEHDISVLVRNMKNVLYDDELSNEKDKCFKICNFSVKTKK
jgi:hypothetical protein